MADDERLSPFHISLYFTLFQFWNLNRFKNPISIARQETMRLSKIGSVNTYIKCIKELDKWQYIKYVPSHNPLKGSLVNLYNFNNTTDNATDISNDKSTNKTSEKTTGKTKKQLVIPSINTINNTNNLNCVNDNEPSQKNNSNNFSDDNSKDNSKSEQKEMPLAFADTKIQKEKNSRQKSSAKKEKESTLSHRAKSRCERPLHEAVKNYFEQKSWPSIEAAKFYNYFESNGWLVGGKTPMKNWHAAANNWIMNIDKFKNNGTHKQEGKSSIESGQTKSRAGNLHSTNNKNFGEPL